MALRPTLSSGLPFTGIDPLMRTAFVSYKKQLACHDEFMKNNSTFSAGYDFSSHFGITDEITKFGHMVIIHLASSLGQIFHCMAQIPMICLFVSIRKLPNVILSPSMEPFDELRSSRLG